MAQFDVHRIGNGLVVDCQSDLLDTLGSRFVVPLVPAADAPRAAARFNPVFSIEGEDLAMLTQFCGAVPRKELGEVITSLSDRSLDVTGALDILIGGV